MTEERRKREEEEEEGEAPLEMGLGAIFRGLAGIMGSVRELTDTAERTATEATNVTGRMGRMSRRGVFGFSIGQLSTGEPKVEPFGNIRQTERGPVVDEVREPIIDLFEDAEHLVVVAEMPGVAEQEMTYEVKGNLLRISSHGSRKYRKELSLPVAVEASGIEATYNNGILQLKLKRREG